MSALIVRPFPPLELQEPLEIAMLIFPNMDQMDLTGPHAVLSRLDRTVVRLVGRSRAAVADAAGLALVPDRAYDEVEFPDVLVVPGGGGIDALYDDEPTLAFVRRLAGRATVVMSVCTGAFLVGAAGLLNGRAATSHWASRELLPFVGARPVDARVVVDAPFVSTAGITAGIDGALEVAAILRGREAAELIALQLEYDPEPPFSGGTPAKARADVYARGVERFRERVASRSARLKQLVRT